MIILVLLTSQLLNAEEWVCIHMGMHATKDRKKFSLGAVKVFA